MSAQNALGMMKPGPGRRHRSGGRHGKAPTLTLIGRTPAAAAWSPVMVRGDVGASSRHRASRPTAAERPSRNWVSVHVIPTAPKAKWKLIRPDRGLCGASGSPLSATAKGLPYSARWQGPEVAA
jgi:hypothetical protein